MWNNLTLKEKAELIQAGVKAGYRDIDSIRERFNSFSKGDYQEPLIQRTQEQLPVENVENSDYSVVPKLDYYKDPNEQQVNKFDKGGNYTVGNLVDAIYQNNPKEEYLGKPSHNYDFTQSEEWANAHGYYPDARGHRDDRVKKPAHPSHPSRGTWQGDNFILTDKGFEDPNYTLFGLNDGRQDPQATLIYDDTIVLPEITVTPNGNYINNSYDNIRLHLKSNGGPIIITNPVNRSVLRSREYRPSLIPTYNPFAELNPLNFYNQNLLTHNKFGEGGDTKYNRSYEDVLREQGYTLTDGGQYNLMRSYNINGQDYQFSNDEMEDIIQTSAAKARTYKSKHRNYPSQKWFDETLNQEAFNRLNNKVKKNSNQSNNETVKGIDQQSFQDQYPDFYYYKDDVQDYADWYAKNTSIPQDLINHRNRSYGYNGKQYQLNAEDWHAISNSMKGLNYEQDKDAYINKLDALVIDKLKKQLGVDDKVLLSGINKDVEVRRQYSPFRHNNNIYPFADYYYNGRDFANFEDYSKDGNSPWNLYFSGVDVRKKMQEQKQKNQEAVKKAQDDAIKFERKQREIEMQQSQLEQQRAKQDRVDPSSVSGSNIANIIIDSMNAPKVVDPEEWKKQNLEKYYESREFLQDDKENFKKLSDAVNASLALYGLGNAYVEVGGSFGVPSVDNFFTHPQLVPFMQGASFFTPMVGLAEDNSLGSKVNTAIDLTTEASQVTGSWMSKIPQLRIPGLILTGIGAAGDFYNITNLPNLLRDKINESYDSDNTTDKKR